MRRNAVLAACSAGIAASMVLSACSSAGESDAVATGATTDVDAAQGLGSGLLVLNGEELPFGIDICFEGDDFKLNEALRLHVEGRGEDARGRSYEVQLIRTRTTEDNVIDVIRVRHDGRPVGASHEAQRVHDLRTDEVTDLWGDRTTPLFELARDGYTLTVAASAVFGDFPGAGGEPAVLGDGELEATCTAAGAAPGR